MEFLRRREPHHPKFACALFLGGRCRKAALHKRLCWLSRRRVEFIDAYIGLGELRLDVDATTAVAISFGLRSNDVLLGFNTQRALELKRRFGISYARSSQDSTGRRRSPRLLHVQIAGAQE